jgi:exopolyphosphatase/pppGpp-phosphohydrolase
VEQLINRSVMRQEAERLKVEVPDTAIAARLAEMPLAELRRLPGLEPARAPVIVAGAIVIATILEVAGLPDLLVSERDILDGAALAARDGGLVSDVTTSLEWRA